MVVLLRLHLANVNMLLNFLYHRLWFLPLLDVLLSAWDLDTELQIGNLCKKKSDMHSFINSKVTGESPKF